MYVRPQGNLLPQIEMGLQFFCDREVFSGWRDTSSLVHAKKFSLNILLLLLSSIASDPTLNKIIRCKYAIPLLFRKRFLFLAGLSERYFGIRMVVTNPGGFMGVTEWGNSIICASSSHGRQGIAD